jgi:hypothetical protein
MKRGFIATLLDETMSKVVRFGFGLPFCLLEPRPLDVPGPPQGEPRDRESLIKNDEDFTRRGPGPLLMFGAASSLTGSPPGRREASRFRFLVWRTHGKQGTGHSR